MPVASRHLAEGAWFALEQCGLLLGDAVDLFDRGRVSTALGLAMFAREEFGKARILLDLHDKTVAGNPIDLEQVRDRTEEHADKQRAAQLSVMLSVPADSRLAHLMRRRFESPSSPEAEATRAEIEELTRSMARRSPAERQKLRERAMYVDPDDAESTWNRPVACSPDQARREIDSVGNDYGVFLHNLDVADKYKAARATLDGWADRPRLPEPRRLEFPSA